MTAKIYPFGAYANLSDLRTPRTLREATGKDIHLNPTKLPKSWEDIAKRVLAIAIGFLLVMVGLSFI